MRIIGDIPHPDFKITLFKMDNRFSVKFESELNEQTYKFRANSELKNTADLIKLVDDEFLKAVYQNFKSMNTAKMEVTKRFFPQIREEFEEII